MKDKLCDLTEQLLQYNRLFLEKYQAAREKGKSEDFYQVIKPFAEKVNELNLEWNSMMKEWLKQDPQKHIHLQRLEVVSKHIEDQSIQAFFPETSRSRLLNANRTVSYFLSEVVKLIQK